MRVLLDECVPERLRHDLSSEAPYATVETARFAGLSHHLNGALLTAMEGRYAVLITVDKNLRHQQNMAGRSVAVIVIGSVNADISLLRPIMPLVARTLATIQPGTVVEI